ncbi:MAG: Acetoin:2,6-dichlorophenolindophenol oxidoreductase subunit alpha [Chlamydiales bacterium]|nr:Acetoin:2,6-dichlorophenolindophenol oxidoreductase subunit alpha [Chlamydiales bacterium]MCH9636141.1 Acetoin:2,6-dichlorophenolindophenol oxidoreductase subunit alpha [Chlamydiales bacterium]MCH9703252.1 pyruvate dehydrogenase (acetyl-transferring) E1 component subunit alpha [Chlamydiota bacterium]
MSEFFSTDPKLSDQEYIAKALKSIGNDQAVEALRSMYLIRHLETRGEAAYQSGKVGGFYHAYSGQEAIQIACTQALGVDNWWVGTYRCHALALLLGESPDAIMAELYGKVDGVAGGRGGSMHLYAKTLLGGFGIVGGHMPIAAGAAFSAKYLKENKIAVCFLGEGAVAQGAFHETLNLASLWDLPLMTVIENNRWGMGTSVERAIAKEPIAESQAPGYGMKGYTLNGMCYFSCYMAFKQLAEDVRRGQPILIECICERFKGHSISDPGLYRSKEELERAKKRDPIVLLRQSLIEHKVLTQKDVEDIDKEARRRILEAMKFADSSDEPPLASLGEGVYADD